ncbi:hypothetical protein [Coleofasciculus sp.]|uniref:hypothetical protein n=1 Tax=Coleofasciculus sp. TaxID=3100458 RepID=UPI003A4A5A77
MVTSTTTQFSRDELCQRWGIKYTQYYERLRSLNLDPKHLTSSDIEELDRLDTHVKNGGKIKDFAASENSTQSESAIRSFGTGFANAPTTPSEDLAPRETTEEPDEDSTGLVTKPLPAIPDPPPEPETPESEIFRHAAELKAYYATHPDLVALNLASMMEETDLPDDLRAKVEEVREVAHPKPNQAALASDILQRHRKKTTT